MYTTSAYKAIFSLLLVRSVLLAVNSAALAKPSSNSILASGDAILQKQRQNSTPWSHMLLLTPVNTSMAYTSSVPLHRPLTRDGFMAPHHLHRRKLVRDLPPRRTLLRRAQTDQRIRALASRQRRRASAVVLQLVQQGMARHDCDSHPKESGQGTHVAAVGIGFGRVAELHGERSDGVASGEFRCQCRRGGHRGRGSTVVFAASAAPSGWEKRAQLEWWIRVNASIRGVQKCWSISVVWREFTAPAPLVSLMVD